ncbi:IS4 ORF [Shigella flexneri 2a]|nr:IS4 ORF [Shigella flexneri 2a]
MFVEHNLIKNIKIFTLAFTLTVVLIQLSRFISPLAIIHSSYIFLAWMPLCVMLSILFIFGWRGVVPVLCGMFCTNLWNFHLSFLLKWHTEFGHLNRGDMLTSEQHRCSNEKKKF